MNGTQKHDCGPSRLQSDTAIVHRRLRYRAPKYLADCCVSAFEVSGRQHLRSASRRKLNIPRFHRSTFGTCGLSQSPVRRFGTHCLIRCTIRPSSLHVLGGTWNRISLLDIRDIRLSALEASPFHEIALYKSTFTIYWVGKRQRRPHWTNLMHCMHHIAALSVKLHLRHKRTDWRKDKRTIGQMEGLHKSNLTHFSLKMWHLVAIILII